MTESVEQAPTGEVPAGDVESQPGDGHEAVIAEALAVIDQALGRVSNRDIVSSGEVADLLLDVRTLLTTTCAAAE
jgi:hypothetical protein